LRRGPPANAAGSRSCRTCPGAILRIAGRVDRDGSPWPSKYHISMSKKWTGSSSIHEPTRRAS
jgi:hypothetical protein